MKQLAQGKHALVLWVILKTVKIVTTPKSAPAIPRVLQGVTDLTEGADIRPVAGALPGEPLAGSWPRGAVGVSGSTVMKIAGPPGASESVCCQSAADQ